MSKVYSSTLSLDELKMEFRNYKLKSINNEINFKISESVVKENKDLLDFLTDNFPNDVITGSLALKLLGLLSRKNNDIDILIKDKNRYDKYILDGYGDDEFTTPNRLGFKTFKHKVGFFTKEKEYSVDFFEDKEVPFLEFDINIGNSFNSNIKKIKIHNPLEIMNFKLSIFSSNKVIRETGRKHNEDLTRIFAQSTWQVK